MVVGGLLIAVAASRTLFRGDPQKYAQWARVLVQQGRYGEAAENFANAISLDPQNAALRVDYGDTLLRMAEAEPELAGKGRAQWIKALELDPKCLPALSRLLETSWRSLLVSSENVTLQADRVCDFADRIIKVDPNDLRAQGYLHMAFVQAWLSNVDVDSKRIDRDMVALAALIKKDPANAELPSFLARAKIFRGQQYLRIRETKRANALFDEAMNIVDQSLQAQPNSVTMCFRASQILSVLMNLQPPEETAAYAARVRQLLERAKARVKPNEPLYVDVNASLAEFLNRYGDPTKAEAVYRELLASRPNDPGIRYMFASALRGNPGKRDEAMRLLESSLVSDQFSTMDATPATKELETRTLQLLTEMRLDGIPAAKNDAERQAAVKQCQEGIDKIKAMVGEDPDLLKLQGKLQLVQGNAVDAIKLFERSAELLKQVRPLSPKDYDMMFLLARAYVATEQTGQARALLTELVSRFEKFVPARMLLVQLLLRDNDVPGAIPHINQLERLAPNDPQVAQFRLATFDMNKQKQQVQEYYSRLPEESRDQRIKKAQFALALNMPDDAVRLLKSVLAQTPGDAETVLMLTRLYVGTGRKAEARQIIASARQASPANKGLLYLERQLDNVTTEELRQLVISDVMKITDDYARELQLYRIANDEGDNEEAFQHLRRAEAAKPDAPKCSTCCSSITCGSTSGTSPFPTWSGWWR